MLETKNWAGLFAAEPAPETSFDCSQKPKLELKWKRIMRALVSGTLNRFEAERHHDHCLNSTIAEIRRDHLVEIDWHWEEVPAMGGRAVARCKRYWVRRTDGNLNRARDLLGMA